MKKLGLMVLTGVLTALLAGCGSTEKPSAATDTASVASGFPNKPVKMVIPYPPGGATDVIFRLIASRAEKELGQPIVPVNMTGATSTVGSRYVKDAASDGYTILGSHDVIATAYLTGVVDYSFEAFEPVSLLTQTPSIAVVQKDTGIKNLQEFKEYVKAHPQSFKWSLTHGSTDHFFLALLMEKIGLDMKDIKMIGYEGTGPQVTALAAKETDGGMFDMPSGKGLFSGGTGVPIGVSYEERLTGLEDVGTMKEQGVDMSFSISRGVFAPKGTPEEVITVIEEAFRKALEDPELQRKITEEQGSVVKFLPHGEYKGFLEELQGKLDGLAKQMDLKK